MEQLGIKHLGRRLACGLKINIGTMPECYQLEMTAEDEMDSATISITDVLQNEHKPILRNLSDLTKEITHKGEKIIPMVDLLKIVDKDYYEEHLTDRYSEIECNAYPNYCDVYFKYMATKSLRIWVNDLCNERFWIIEKLLEWHFHIDEPEGTWIDVNTLPKNPYE